MLEVTDLSKSYGEVVALDGATFSVKPARITGFLGPNGAGKTTTMRAIFGLVNPDRGTMSWRGAQHPWMPVGGAPFESSARPGRGCLWNCKLRS